MKIKKHIVSPLQVNCYVVWDEESGLAMVVDPGSSAGKIARTISEKGLRLEAIVHTHSHWDHTGGSNRLQRITGAPIMRHHLETRSGYLHRPRKADGSRAVDLEDGQEFAVGALRFRVIHTPGHSRGGICLYGEESLFSGDLLFQGSVGRWDLRGGDIKEILRSLNVRLSGLPDATRVYPGHGPATVLGVERESNAFFHPARLGGIPR